MKILNSIVFTAIVFLFNACSESPPPSGVYKEKDLGTHPKNTLVRGNLLNIGGVTYSCGSIAEAKTNKVGEFICKPNTDINFKIGGITIGSFSLDSSLEQAITPEVLYDTGRGDIRVSNFNRFIQSLDDDNNPSNGIIISEFTNNALMSKELDLTSSSLDKNELNTIIESLGKSLTSVDDASSAYEKIVKQSEINETFYYKQWYIDKRDNASINTRSILSSYTGRGVKIAVIDNGFDVEHEDLSDIIDTYDLKNTGTTTDVSQNTKEIHGTSVTGIIGARKNGIGIKGIASNSELILIKIYYGAKGSSIFDIISMFKYAQNKGADIINCSWGGSGSVHPAFREVVEDLATNGRNGKGISIVFASGNSNTPISAEANLKAVISVGATDSYNRRSGYSNYGRNLDIVAPGGGFYKGLTTLVPMGFTYGEDTIDYFDDFVGTSAAAPVVSGVIALMLEKNPNLTRVEIENILKRTASKIGNEYYTNSKNDYYGHGKVNLFEAMMAVPNP